MSTVMLADNFIRNIKHAMEKLGMNQQELSDKSGVHYVTLNRILNRHHEPTFTVCEKLAKAVGIDPPKIFAKPPK